MSAKLNESKSEILRLQSELTKISGNCFDEDGMKNNALVDLVDKLNSVQTKLITEQRIWNEEKRKIASSYASAEQTLAAKHRESLSDHRSKIASLEDKLESERERYKDLEKDKMILIQQASAAKDRHESQKEQCIKLKRDLQILKQTLSVTHDNRDLPGGSQDDLPTRSNPSSTNQAEMRLLQNKVGLQNENFSYISIKN